MSGGGELEATVKASGDPRMRPNPEGWETYHTRFADPEVPGSAGVVGIF
jgi:hypothetical protein